MQIEENELKNFGIHTKHEEMDNGELRFRLTANDGSGYIRTVAGRNGAWQNSHSHKFIRETYIVQSGWMALAQLINNNLEIKIYRPGDVLTIKIDVIHNVYLPKDAVTHTVKHGKTKDTDWLPNKEFDNKTKLLCEKDILKMANSC